MQCVTNIILKNAEACLCFRQASLRFKRVLNCRSCCNREVLKKAAVGNATCVGDTIFNL